MGENETSEVTWKHVVSAIFAAGIMWIGVSRAWNKGTNAWSEMANLIMEIGSWILLALAVIVLGFVTYFVFKAVLDKCQGLYLMWEKSKSWCDNIEQSFSQTEVSHEKLVRMIEHLESEMASLRIDQEEKSEELKKLKELPSMQQAVNFKQVENDLLGKTI